ncbi:(2Fe-2S)-binding protein [Kitasatospora purpeofusca]|uniref:(2Fe-2S)-binding protein n=1 Tax=Kitasatospora purpeofusca TaxID=67352 RepID=A0ABZ1U9M2_9ACTN|nr:(2Fe-2S)-binding protein [Kitasatospora purpeofusca]
MSAHSTRPTPVATAVGRTGPGTGPTGPAATATATATTHSTALSTAHSAAHSTATTAGPAAYRRLGQVLPALRVRCAPPRSGRGWLAGADLVARPAALRELISHDARQGLARYGQPLRPDVAAGIGLHRFVWPTALLFTLPWFLERRVPLLAPGDIAVRRRTGELTVRPGAFLCLPDDPAAPGPAARPATFPTVLPTAPPPGARTVPDEAALAAGLRSALADFLTPVLDAFRPEVRRGPRTLWAMATDAVVEGLWYAGGLLGEEERARTELAALFAPGASGASGPPDPRAARPAPECAPFTPGAGFTAPASGGTERSDRCRASCCLVYTARAEAMCAGCPRVTRG